MLTTKSSRIKVTKDQVQGIKETEITVEIGPNEPLDEVPVRIDEVAAVIDDLVAHDTKFIEMDLGQQAAYLEHIFIFGPAGQSQHFRRDDFWTLLVAKRDGKIQELKDKAAEKAAKKAAEPPKVK